MSKLVMVGNVPLGGGNPIVIQSMTTTKASNVSETIAQIEALVREGCEMVRIAILDEEDVEAIGEIKSRVKIPVIADIQYDYKLAILSIKNGIDKVRINPGNIGSEEKVRELVKVAKDYGVPIRVGANTGSLRHRDRYSERWIALAESALEEVRILEKLGFTDIVISAKSSNVRETIKANEYIHEKVDYPIHLGVTEAGIYETSIVKSSIAIGHLILKGIGDTLRVSIAGDPVREVRVARKMLIALGKRKGVEVIACPGCSRAEIDVEKLATFVEDAIGNMRIDLKVAVMGCVVNGIGEGKDADIGIAGVKDGAVIFRGGKIIERVKLKDLDRRLKEIIKELKEAKT